MVFSNALNDEAIGTVIGAVQRPVDDSVYGTVKISSVNPGEQMAFWVPVTS